MADFLEPAPQPPSTIARWAVLTFIILFIGFQILFPLRHWLYPGDPGWTEEGHKFAWMMKLRDKSSNAIFYVHDPETDTLWQVDPDDYLRSHQEGKVASRPELILQFAYYLEELWIREEGVTDVEVTAYVCASLNGRPGQLLIDPDRDLTQLKITWAPADWILPLVTEFERPPNRTHRRRVRC